MSAPVNAVPASARRMPAESRHAEARRILGMVERAIPAMRTCDLNHGETKKLWVPFVEAYRADCMLSRRANRYRRFIRRCHAAAFELLTDGAL